MSFSEREAYRVGCLKLKEQILEDHKFKQAILKSGSLNDEPDRTKFKFAVIKMG